MSRWLQNVGSFLDQLDTKAAVVVTSAVSGRDNATDLNDDDDDDDLDHNVFNHTTNIETRLYQPTNTTSIISNEDITSDMNNAYKNDDDDCHDANDNGSGDAVVLNDPNSNIETRIQPIISSSQSPFGDDGINNDDNDQINYSSILLNQGTTNSPVVVTSIPDVVPSSSNMEIENDGWKNDDMIDDITERSNITTLSTNGGKEPDNIQSHPHPHNTNKIESSNETVHDETAVVAAAATDAAADDDDDDVPESNQQPESTLSPTPISTTTTTTTSDATSTIEILTHNDITSTDQTKHFVERIARLEQEVRQYQNQLHQIRQEKQNEVYVITKEARTLRRHLATINEQLVMADREVGAQRQELENAAQRFEMDQIKYKQDVLAIQSKHQYDIQQIKLSHQEAMTNLQAQSQNQMDVLKKELSDIRQQRQQEGGDWNKELTEAIQREHMVRNECQALIDERDTLLVQIDTLRSQQELLGNRLESLTAIADNAAIREREAEVQLDNAMTLHAKQLNQRQAREAELERTVSELSAMLVIERSKHTNMMSVHEMVSSSSNDTTSSSSSSSYKAEDDAAVEIETMKSQLEIERQHNSSLKKEIDDIVRERQEEILLAQTRQAQHEKKISELTQQLLELRATIRDVKQQDMTLQQRQTDESKLDAQRVQELSEELIRMRERMSVSNSETAALRNRLQAALNRAIVAEAAAESAFHSSELNTAWSGNNSNNDLEQGGITVRRRGTTNQRTSNSKSSSSDVPTIRKALRLDGTQGGIGRRAQGIGKSLDMLDGFLAQSGEILRFNAIARLCFVVYLLLLHVWTFVLLTFHIHGFEAIHGSLDRSAVQPHGPGALMQQAAIVNAPSGN